MARRYHVIFNPNAGTALALGLTSAILGEKFQAAGLDFSIDDDDKLPMEERIARAISGPAEVIVAAGGDGTVTAVASALTDSDKTLAVLPLGTMNAMSKDLGIPLDIDGAINALESLVEKRIDVGTVDGRVFLHNVLIGVIPSIAVVREAVRHETRFGLWLKFLRFVMRRLTRARRLAIAIEPEHGNHRIARLQTLAIANNSYDQSLGAFLTRKRIDEGRLTLYTVTSLGVGDAIRLGIEMLAGRWHNDDVIDFEHMRAVTIRTKKPSLLVTIDGEVAMLPTPLKFEIKPLALSILAKPEAAAQIVEEKELAPEAA